jgi:hypothetical protein
LNGDSAEWQTFARDVKSAACLRGTRLYVIADAALRTVVERGTR